MSKIILIIIALSVSSIAAMPYEPNENVDGEELYVLAPLSRVRRQSLFGGPRHRLGASVFANGDFGRSTYGGQLGYTHIPSGNNLNFGASHTQGFGTELKAQGTYNFFKKPNTRFGATGYYSRNFGGPFGTGKPNYGVGLELEHRFK